MNGVVVILMGSGSDEPHVDKIAAVLDEFGIPHVERVSSAHRTPLRLLEILKECEADPRPKVYVTVAGLSNALSGMVDAQVSTPVIACPPLDPAFGGADIFSSLRMPVGVAPLMVLEPANAALAAAKMLALAEPGLAARVAARQQELAEKVYAADRDVSEG
ncbi:MAG: AIR carboxylase family protein [Chloroflexi bacterium]|nr:AIR carboxylase family protein [Chloroflexota bacterium]